MTVVLEETQAAAVIPEPPRNIPAPWRIRAGAFAVDVLPGLAVVATMALVSLTVPRGAWWWVSTSVGGLAILLVLVNRLLLPAVTGWSLGRALFGIAVTRRDGDAVDAWWLLLRDLAHLLDTAAVFVGWLWPLWDSRRRTFADMLVGTEVRHADPDGRPADVRRWTMVAVLTAAAICVGGAATSYGVVYANARATDRAIAEISVQGPKMVAQMLTYDPKTLDDDFARALALTTDKYRKTWAELQDGLKKGHPVVNEYGPLDGAVVSANPDRVTMLLFMQGQWGAPPRVIVKRAIVRATFAKDSNHNWRVDNLDTVPKSKGPGSGK